MLALVVVAPGTARSADACRPLRTLPAYATIKFDRQARGLSPELRATVQKGVVISADPLLFDLSESNRTAITSRPIAVTGQVLGFGVIDEGSVELKFAADETGRAVVSGEDGRYLVQLKDGAALSADGKALKVAPNVTSAHPFVVTPKADVAYVSPSSVRIGERAILRWDLENDSSIGISLIEAVRLEETGTASAARRLSVVRPSRGLPAGTVKVEVNAPGFDIRTRPLAFCFRTPAADGAVVSVVSVNPKLISETTDAGTFELVVPDMKTGWSPWGQPVDIRVIGMAGERVGLDDTAPFVVANAWVAATVSLLIIVVLFLLSSFISGVRNPFEVVRMLILRPTNRYSLSDLQILMWTLLAIFALAFVWVSNGELPTLSAGVLVLLGITGTSSVLSRTVDAFGSDKEPPVAPGQESIKSLVMTSPNGLDLLRFQMLGFTIVAWVYSLVSLLRSDGLPELPQNLYVLMGISNATYLGGKVADKVADTKTMAVDPTGVNPFESALSDEQIKGLQASLVVPQSGKLDERTREAVKKYKEEHGMVPADGSVDRWLLENVAPGGTMP
jgi:hypothetical protein